MLLFINFRYKNNMPRKQKELEVIVRFDDIEYSDEEKAILFQQFFETLASIGKIPFPPGFGKAFVEAINEKEASKNKSKKT